MATVSSLTEARILELLAGWEAVGLSQDDINANLVQLKATLADNDARLEDLNNNILPELRETLAANDLAVAKLNDEVLPGLETTLTQTQNDLLDLSTVVVAGIREDVDSTMQNALDRPKVYVQPEAPTDPDDEDRYLVVGDVWFDSDDNNKQTVWNGVEWSTFGVEITDFSLTVKKFMSSSHMIY